MQAAKWVVIAIVAVLLAAIVYRFWREIVSGIVMIVFFLISIGIAIAMITPTPRQSEDSRHSDEQGPPGWWWAERADERREAELAERYAARAEMEASRAEQAAERAAWEEYRRNR